jgi:diaminohydroxyphosphoribosylaminopyrimidine deaminase / 5-amino-6-(5-phosphoribosylamino)uracil reductase
LLEGGPRLAQAFLQADVVDQVLLFVAPRLGGVGPLFAPELAAPVELRRLTAAAVGDDVLLSAYVHEP